MTLAAPPRGLLLPSTARRSPPRYFASTTKSASYASTRVLGLWVPMEAFRAGTLIRATGSGPTISPALSINIGGRASVVAGGVNVNWTTGPAAAVGWRLFYQQQNDGIVTTWRTGGSFSGATSLACTTATNAGVFLQPMNFVELNCSGTFTFDSATLEVIPPQRLGWEAYQEVLAT